MKHIIWYANVKYDKYDIYLICSHYLDITEMSHVDFDDSKDVIRDKTKEDTIAKDIEVVNLDDDEGEMKKHIVNEDYDTSKYFYTVKV